LASKPKQQFIVNPLLHPQVQAFATPCGGSHPEHMHLVARQGDDHVAKAPRAAKDRKVTV